MRPILSLLPAPLRHRVRRRPSLHLVLTAAVALLTGTVAYRLLDLAAQGAARYGDPVTVAVAQRDLPAGHRVSEADVELRELPARAVAPSAVRGRSLGRVLHRAVSSGEVLVGADLTEPGTSGTAALLPPGTVALAVPAGPGSVALHVRDRVDLVAIAPDDATPLGLVAAGATVVATDDDSVTVAVPSGAATDVAAAIAGGTVVPALRGADDPGP